MTDTDAAIEQQSWAFALRVYAKPGVAEACLRLQDQAGVDVMLLLAVAFACSRGILLSPADIDGMDAACRPWREDVVQPLRALRVALKTGPSPAPDAATEKLRTEIKASELHAERLQNDLLARWLSPRIRGAHAVPADASRLALRHVLAKNALGRGDSDIATTIEIIAAAISA